MSALFFILALLSPLLGISLKRRFTGTGLLARQFTQPVRNILTQSFEYAVKTKADSIGPEILIYAITKGEIGVAFQLLKTQGFKRDEFIKDMESKFATPQPNEVPNENIRLTKEAEVCLKQAVTLASKKRSKLVNSGHILITTASAKSVLAMQNKYQMPTSASLEARLHEDAFTRLAELETIEEQNVETGDPKVTV